MSNVYFEDEPGRRSAAKSLDQDEARRGGVTPQRYGLGLTSRKRAFVLEVIDEHPALTLA